MHYDLLLFAVGQYSAEVQAKLRASVAPEFLKLRHCDSVDRISSTVLRDMQKRFPHLYIDPGKEIEGRQPLVERWFSHAYNADIDVVRPVAAIEGVDNQFIRASRPNGSDRASWEDFRVDGEGEGDVRKS